MSEIPEQPVPPQPSYGQPPQFGQPQQPQFGQPQQPPYGQPPAFGAPQQPQFGQPPAFGAPQQPPHGQPPYGQPQQPPYGQPPQPHFGQPHQDLYAALPAPLAPADAFAWGWRKFTENAGAFIVGQLAWVLIGLAVLAGWIVLMSVAGVFGGSSSTEAAVAAFVSTGLVGLAVVAVIGILVGVFASAGITNAALLVADGHKVSVGDLFKVRSPLQVLFVAVLMSVAGSLSVFTFVGPLVIQVFAVYVVLLVIDKQMGAIDAIVASFRMALANLGPIILLVVLSYLANGLGVALCGVGSLVSVPVTLLATVWLFRRQLNEHVAA